MPHVDFQSPTASHTRRTPLHLLAAILLLACTDDRALEGPVTFVPHLAPPPEHRMEVLLSPDTVNSYALGINATGTMIGTSGSFPGRPSMAVNWAPTGDITELTDGLDMRPMDINDLGDIVATRGGSSWVYVSPTKRYQLPLPLRIRTARASAINGERTVVGCRVERTGVVVPLQWQFTRPSTWTPVRLPLPDSAISGAATDITVFGDIAGWVTYCSGTDLAVVWLANQPAFTLDTIASRSGIRINNHQEVLLHARLNGGGTEPRVVHAPWRATLDPVGWPSGSQAFGLNDAGRVVGVTPVSYSFEGFFMNTPVTARRDGIRPPEDSPFSPSARTTPPGEAVDVNNCGTPVGNPQRNSNYFRRAVRWVRINPECGDDDTPLLRTTR